MTILAVVWGLLEDSVIINVVQLDLMMVPVVLLNAVQEIHLFPVLQMIQPLVPEARIFVFIMIVVVPGILPVQKPLINALRNVQLLQNINATQAPSSVQWIPQEHTLLFQPVILTAALAVQRNMHAIPELNNALRIQLEPTQVYLPVRQTAEVAVIVRLTAP